MKKINLKHAFITSAIVMALSGCSSSDDDTVRVVPVEPTSDLGSVSLKAVFGGCATADSHTDIEIIFHDKSGAVVATANPDENGAYQGDIPENAKHVSVVDTVVREDSRTLRKVYTHMDISGDVSLGTMVFDSPQECSVAAVIPCQTYFVDVEDAAVTYPDYKMLTKDLDSTFLNYEYKAPLGEPLKKAHLCRSEKYIPFAVVSDDKEIVKLARVEPNTDANTGVFQLLAEDFSYDGVAVTVPELDDGANVVITSYMKGKQETGGYDLLFNMPASTAHVIFPDLADYSQYSAQVGDDIDLDAFQLILTSYSESTISSKGEVSFTDLIELDNDLGQAFLSGHDSSNFSFSYDFSALDDRLKLVDWQFSFSSSEGESYQWHITGGTAGNIPEFQFGNAFTLESIEFNALPSFQISLSAYPKGPAALNDYRTFLATQDKDDFSKAENQSYIQVDYKFINKSGRID
ncbi:hypothetical protein J8M21_07910 [Pseudoalteromonas luteoviolacea]|uniref:hypothetical protein n=1 Tax=Pseudoalteromonas luteoviolacea TaxID=43657 RepID=UPI001B3A7394|nr:hypothetical protein [Pseudoalteromonas luteoviolacea]MBQ4877134.1 hypothetical protein [Pseudoalteromonas luteoviolacea]MBQ4905995.1 hypothetical protein [Pseudoalteromonas luteoviolacea]